jgi:hypothetical protein
MEHGADPFIDITSLNNLEMEIVWKRFSNHKTSESVEDPTYFSNQPSGVPVFGSSIFVGHTYHT